MQALFVILKDVDLANDLIHALAKAGVHGGTIINSTGMANALVAFEDLPVFGMLRRIVNEGGPEKECSKTMIFVLKDEEMEMVKNVIHKVVGDLNKPNSGILFAVPVTFVEGLGDQTWAGTH